MNTVEAVRRIFEGEKIRHIQWEAGRYLYAKNDVIIDSKTGEPYPLKANHDKWEVFIKDSRKKLSNNMMWVRDLYNRVASTNTAVIGCAGLSCMECPLRIKDTRGTEEYLCDTFYEKLSIANKEYKIGELDNE